MPGAWLNQAVSEESMQPKKQALVRCPLPPVELGGRSRAAREREARVYWNRLSPAQEAWVLRKMDFARMGEPRSG
jgi:hypothetical protein